MHISLHICPQLRDQQGAREDLQAHGVAHKRRQLEATMSGSGLPPALGMLLFSCK